MSKNNRVFVIFFSILLFLTVGMSEKAYAEQISGTVHNELVGTFDKSQTSNRTIEEMKKIARDDHNVTLLITNNQVTISENIGVSDGATLRVQNQEVPIKNGKFTVNTKKCSTRKYNFSDANVKTDVTVKNNDKTINIVNRIDYGTMIDAMDKMNQTTSSNTSSNLLGMIDNTIFLKAEASARYVGQKSGQKVSKGAHVHCNRFNGIHSNHRYYSRLNGQGWVNYYKSDCWYKHKAYKCPFTKADKKCDGLLKHRAHNCSSKGHWHITCWYRN